MAQRGYGTPLVGRRSARPSSTTGRFMAQFFSADQKRILTWSDDGTARLWDIEWAMRDPTAPEFIGDLCRIKLVGASMQSEPIDPKRQVGVRHIDAVDITAAPILLDREGQDVCAPPPTKWELLLYLIGMSK